MKRILTFILTLSLVVGMSINAFASTGTAGNGVVNMNSGDAQIKITGNEGQSLVGKRFYIYRLFHAENSAGLESINYTFNPEFQSILQRITGEKLEKESATVTEYEVIDYIQSLNRNVSNGTKTTQVKEGSYSEFRYFIENLRDEIIKEGAEGDVIEVTSTDISNSVTITGLEYGYYLVDEVTAVADTHQASSLCIVNTANPTVSVTIKSDYPTVVMKIQEDDNQDAIGNGGWNDIADYEIGQDIPYKYESEIPNLNGYDTYYWAWHGNMDKALTLQSDTIQIVLSGTVKGEEKRYTLLETEFHLITDSVDTTFKIEIENIKGIIDREFDNQNADNENIYDQEITVTYKANLNENAAEDLGRPGFENDVRVEFSNNPNKGYESQTGFTPWDTVVCFSYQINGLKINNYETPLEGAVFCLYKDEACEQEMVEVTSNSKGEFEIFGLGGGTYYLKEVSAPTGYRPLLDPVKIQIQPTFTSERNSYVKGEGAGKEIMELAATAKVKTFVAGSYAESETPLEVNQEEGSLNLSIVNEIGKKLPITGSQMMLLLSLTGIVLMFAALRKGRKKYE